MRPSGAGSTTSVVTSDNESAADVLTQAIVRDWIDQPAIARRTRLGIDKALNPSLDAAGPAGPTTSFGPSERDQALRGALALTGLSLSVVLTDCHVL